MKHLDLLRTLGLQVLSQLAPCLAILCTAGKRRGGIVPCFSVALDCPFPSLPGVCLCLAEGEYLLPSPFPGGTGVSDLSAPFLDVSP